MIENKGPLVSVIVPVYNVELYLKECVRSIIHQTYTNVEIILIDDGSSDNSASICDAFVSKDSRIKVIHKQNSGLSSARNVGIEKATGKYLLFVDSDDWISKEMVADMISLAEQRKSQLIVSPITHKINKINKKNKKVRSYTISQEGLLKSFFSEGYISTSASGKLYLSSLWKNERFPEGMIFEDYATIYKIVLACDNIQVLGNYYYYYRPNQNGITGGKFSTKKLQYFDITRKIKETLPKYGYANFEKDINNRTTRYAISFFRNISLSHYNNAEVTTQLVCIIREAIVAYLASKYSFKSKLYGVLISIWPELALKVFR